jgi:hypothetical protein
VLLDGERVVGAALDRCVVRHDHALDSLDVADAGHDTRARRVVVVQAIGRVGAQLQERAGGVDEPIDPFADRHLASLAMPTDGAFVTAGPPLGQRTGTPAEVLHHGAHRIGVGAKGLGGRIERGAQDGHAPRLWPRAGRRGEP